MKLTPMKGEHNRVKASTDTLTLSLFDPPPTAQGFKPPPPTVEVRSYRRRASPPRPPRPTLDKQRAHEVTEAAIEKCVIDPQWFDHALRCVRHVAEAFPALTSDDVWAYLLNTRWVGDFEMHRQNKSALGPVIRRAAKEGYIVATGERKDSIRPETHRRPLRVWKSNLFVSLSDSLDAEAAEQSALTQTHQGELTP